MTTKDPHADSPIVAAGAAPEAAAAAIVMIHGRGATAQSILSLLPVLQLPMSVAAIAPQAAGNTWYPHSFLAPLEANQPYLDSALRRIETLVADLLSRGMVSERIALLGFSQGACLACEFAARHPRPYAAVIAFSGGLIGPPGTKRDDVGSLAGVDVFLGCDDSDPHIPFERVIESGETFQRMRAQVDLRRYHGMGHTIDTDEIDACRDILTRRFSPKLPT